MTGVKKILEERFEFIIYKIIHERSEGKPGPEKYHEIIRAIYKSELESRKVKYQILVRAANMSILGDDKIRNSLARISKRFTRSRNNVYNHFPRFTTTFPYNYSSRSVLNRQ